MTDREIKIFVTHHFFCDPDTEEDCAESYADMPYEIETANLIFLEFNEEKADNQVFIFSNPSKRNQEPLWTVKLGTTSAEANTIAEAAYRAAVNLVRENQWSKKLATP